LIWDEDTAVAFGFVGTVGAVVSTGAVTVSANVVERTAVPAVPVTVTVVVPSGVDAVV
jgi:hypothetical protein